MTKKLAGNVAFVTGASSAVPRVAVERSHNRSITLFCCEPDGAGIELNHRI